MSPLMSNILIFVCGNVFGVSGLISLSLYAGAQTRKKRAGTKATVGDPNSLGDITSYGERLKKVQELTKQQLALAGAVDQPSKNAVHSKYKNGLNAEIKSIEEQKAMILQSILRDGFDPSVTILNADGEKEEMKLSTYMGQIGLAPGGSSSPTEEEDPNGGKKVGKFTVYNGGGSDTTH